MKNKTLKFMRFIGPFAALVAAAWLAVTVTWALWKVVTGQKVRIRRAVGG